MWLWQQRRFAKKSKFLTKLLTVSFCLHIITVFCLFFLYKGYDTSFLQVRSVAHDVVVKVLPLGKKASARAKKATGTKVAQQKKAKKVAPKKKTVLKKQSQKVTQKAPQKKIVKQEVKKREQKKVVEKKEIKKEQKQEPVKKQAEPNKQQVARKDEKEDEVTYVTQKEYNVIAAQQALQEAIIDVWTPPAGMSQELVCTVALTVDWNGKLKESVVEGSSGVLVYDIAVEQALEEVEIPKQLWGKSLTVAFKP